MNVPDGGCAFYLELPLAHAEQLESWHADGSQVHSRRSKR